MGLLAVGFLLAGCSGPSSTPGPGSQSAGGSGTAASSPSASPKADATDPLTGGKPSKNEVFAVKIENTAAARPQVGLAAADIVVSEQVEAGITRLIGAVPSFPYRPTRPSRPATFETTLQTTWRLDATVLTACATRPDRAGGDLRRVESRLPVPSSEERHALELPGHVWRETRRGTVTP